MVDLIAIVVAFILELTIHLVALILSSAYFAAHSRGLQRICAGIAVFLGLYLLLALLRGFVPELNLPQLAGLFSWPLAGLAIFGLLLCATVPFAVAILADRQQQSTGPSVSSVAPGPQPTPHDPPLLLIYVLSFAIMFGAFALYSSAYRAPRLTDRLCQDMQSRTPQALRDRLTQGVDIARNMTGKDLALLSVCEEPE